MVRWTEADSDDDELAAMQEELDVLRVGEQAEHPLPAKRGAITQLVKRGLAVPGNRAGGETKQQSHDNLDDPRTPIRKPLVATSGGSPHRKRNCRGTKRGTPAEKALNMSRKCVVWRAYRAAVSEARKLGANEEDAARAGRKAYQAASAAYARALTG